MINPILTKNLSGGNGRVSINWDGTIMIQQGRPFGVMANAGEAFLSIEDLALIQSMLDELRATGWKPVPADAIVAL